jgi:phage shock protein E
MDISKVFLVVIAALTLFLFFRSRGHDTLDGQKARQLVQSGAVLVDVRTPSEYSSGHIEGARNVPIQELGQRLSEFESKTRPLVVYCRSGNRSRTAARILKEAGFTEVHDLGAMSRW